MFDLEFLSKISSNLKKLKHEHKTIYGIMAHGIVPEELIFAAGGFPLRLWLSGNEESATKGIEYLTASTCSFARSTIGHIDLKNQYYNELDAIVGSNFCNGELCSTEIISEYFNIPKIDLVLPSTKNEAARKFMMAELQHFKEEIERFQGNSITDDSILEAIKLYNRERKLIQEIAQIQSSKNYLLTGSECLDLLYHHFLFGVEVAIANLKQVKESLSSKTHPQEGKKLIFAGNGIAIGDNIIQLLENEGFSVIKNLTWTGLDYYTSSIEETGNLYENIAYYYINSENSGRMLLSDNYFKNIAKIYKQSNADGIIFYMIKHCSIIPSLISTKLKKMLSEQEIPYLEIEREYNTPLGVQLQTRLQAFKEMIG